MEKGKNFWRIFFLALAVTGGVLLLGELLSMGIVRFYAGADGASIGIIGGYDGPTAVFVTTSGGILSRGGKALLGALGLLAGIFVYRKLKRIK